MTHVVNTKVVQGLGDFDLLLGVEESVGELLSLTKSTLNDLEAGDIAQEVGNTDVVAVGVAGSGGVGVLASLNAGETGVVTFMMICYFRIPQTRRETDDAIQTYHWHWGQRRWPAHWARGLHQGTL